MKYSEKYINKQNEKGGNRKGKPWKGTDQSAMTLARGRGQEGLSVTSTGEHVKS